MSWLLFMVFVTPVGEHHVLYSEYESAESCQQAIEEFPKIRISLENFKEVYCLDEVVGE